MKQTLTILTLISFMGASAGFADSDVSASATDTKKIVQSNFVETAQKGVKLSGYVDAGYSYNFAGTGNQSNVQGRFGSDTAQKGDFNLYAFKLALEKALTSENKAQAGFRADVILGEDANYLANRTAGQNINTNQDSNALFLEQAYASFRVPVGNGWDFKVGSLGVHPDSRFQRDRQLAAAGGVPDGLGQQYLQDGQWRFSRGPVRRPGLLRRCRGGLQLLISVRSRARVGDDQAASASLPDLIPPAFPLRMGKTYAAETFKLKGVDEQGSTS